MSDVKTKKNGKYLREESQPKHRKKIKSTVSVVLGIVVVLFIGLVCLIGGLKDRSAYQTIVHGGYIGTQEQWLASFVGEEVGQDNAEGAYELAVENGYMGTEAQWIEAIIGVSMAEIQASPYALACENGFEGSLVEWLTEIADEPENLGMSDNEGQKTEYELACEYGYSGTFIEWIVSVANDRVLE